MLSGLILSCCGFLNAISLFSARKRRFSFAFELADWQRRAPATSDDVPEEQTQGEGPHRK